MRTTVSSTILILILVGCTESDFSGAAAKRDRDTGKNRPDQVDSSSDDEGGDEDVNDGDDNDVGGPNDGKIGTDSDNDGEDGTEGDDDKGAIDGPDAGIEIDEDEKTHKPKACIVENVKFTPGDGANCPAHYAAYTADDGKSPNFGCCPLPAKDILSKDPPQVRGTNCLTNEVITGVSGGSVSCTKINTKRYKLDVSRKTCYAGSGASGGGGTGACGVPNATFQALISRFGSDACIGQPYGSLIVGRTGKNCADVTSAQLKYVDNDQPVKMYE